jgi:hypothetical protein
MTDRTSNERDLALARRVEELTVECQRLQQELDVVGSCAQR